jgi:ribonuclease HI
MKNTKTKQAYTEIRVFTDGGARGNPGPAAVGVVILDDNNNIISETEKFIGSTTNNFAEYSALIEALNLLKEIDAYRIVFYTDSNLVYSQIKGFWKIKSPELKILNEQAKEMLKTLPDYNFILIPREKNKSADRLVNKALDRQKQS